MRERKKGEGPSAAPPPGCKALNMDGEQGRGTSCDRALSDSLTAGSSWEGHLGSVAQNKTYKTDFHFLNVAHYVACFTASEAASSFTFCTHKCCCFFRLFVWLVFLLNCDGPGLISMH